MFAQSRADLQGIGEPQFSQREDALQNLDLQQALAVCHALLPGAGRASSATSTNESVTIDVYVNVNSCRFRPNVIFRNTHV